LNLQRCEHVTAFPSHSYEQYYQGIRRCWRFGQDRPVRVDMVLSQGEVSVLANLRRKAVSADLMFSSLVAEMNDATTINTDEVFETMMEAPAWM